MTVRNAFAAGLLNYSAERDDSISAPYRWESPPPLIISDNPLHREMENLAAELWTGTKAPVWYCLVGGPGNGKSEAVGAFVRKLDLLSQRSSISSARETRGQGEIPHSFMIELPRGMLELVQDISVPESQGSMPERDFLDELAISFELGLHLVCCANRGMLLRAARLAKATPELRWLLPVLEAIDARSAEDAMVAEARSPIVVESKHVDLRVWPLDHESVFFGDGADNAWLDPSGSLADRIVQKATALEHWEGSSCPDCPARSLCPILADAQWLRDPARRLATLRLLRRAEILSGQRLVLRELLGLVSLVLVGSAGDFGGSHPCDWVQDRVDTTSAPRPRDAVALLELVSHRIYQELFARRSPSGLVLDRTDGERDRWLLDEIRRLPVSGEDFGRSALQVDARFPKHAGPMRLVGPSSVLEPFDPAKDSTWSAGMPLDLDCQMEDLVHFGLEHQGPLEHQLGEIFQVLERQALGLDPHENPTNILAALYRWASVFYLRLLGTANGLSPLADVLDGYLMLLQKPTAPIVWGERSLTMRDLMLSAVTSQEGIELAPRFFATLPRPKVQPIQARERSTAPPWPSNDRLALRVSLAGGSGHSLVIITGPTFIELWKRHALGVADWSLSPTAEEALRSWIEDFVVTSRVFENQQDLMFRGQSQLIFEVSGPGEVQVRLQQ